MLLRGGGHIPPPTSPYEISFRALGLLFRLEARSFRGLLGGSRDW